MSTYYDSEGDNCRTPPLKPTRPKATPSPSPPPFIPKPSVSTQVPSSPEDVSSHPSKRRKRSNRPKTKASLGDAILVSYMDPNRPDIAQVAGEQPIPSDSEPDVSDGEFNSPTEGHRLIVTSVPQGAQNTAAAALRLVTGGNDEDEREQFERAKDSFMNGEAKSDSPQQGRSPTSPTNARYDQPTPLEPDSHRHGPPGTDQQTSRQPVQIKSEFGGEISRLPYQDQRSPRTEQFPALVSPISTNQNYGNFPLRSRDELALAPIKPISPASPERDKPTSSIEPKSLPSISHIITQAGADAVPDVQARHRQSFSNGPSPTFHIPNGTQRSPPINHSSPISEASPGFSKPFSPAASSSAFSPMYRRASQASETGRQYPPPITSATPTDSYQSSTEGFSPNTQPTTASDRSRMSIDESGRPILPLPGGPSMHISHVPPHGSGGFKCDHQGCTAAPFQTQYLLNSHANVHSSQRPHFCPVRECPRAEGGKGFKRKNEMIRHGLVHESPGYVCPFCPDREHKYPRPDNLQRHVRVHHLDKNKDDEELRRVLAQRPEGGSKGRRRRVHS